MQGKGVTPFAFGDKDGWPAMGTFDILNMRINGFDFHMSLMGGDEAWDSNEVKKVFETWKDLLPYHQEDPLGRTWQETATSLAKGEAGMMMFGTFIGDAIPDAVDDLDFFIYPQIDSSIARGRAGRAHRRLRPRLRRAEPGRGQGVPEVPRHRRGAGRRQRRRGRPDDRRQLQREPGQLHRAPAQVGRGGRRRRHTSRSSWTVTRDPTSPPR